ncbi:MAG: carboxypeptidase regulatory-like domain-containing protein [Isosphaeraceae bacterium]|nr:carboxypeptidase regulatory-like domain-containing protein [Isosphaeraceae bacterium]
MRTQLVTWIRWAVPLALLGMIGCGGDPDGTASLVPVKGTVTLNGQPLAGAKVSFIPDPGNKTGTAGGDTTGPEGSYMARYRNRFGLAPGKYKVTVVPEASSDPSPNVSEAFKDDPFMAGEGTRVAQAGKRGVKKPEVKGEFDAEVAAPKSTLDFDVNAAGSPVSSGGKAPAK